MTILLSYAYVPSTPSQPRGARARKRGDDWGGCIGAAGGLHRGCIGVAGGLHRGCIGAAGGLHRGCIGAAGRPSDSFSCSLFLGKGTSKTGDARRPKFFSKPPGREALANMLCSHEDPKKADSAASQSIGHLRRLFAFRVFAESEYSLSWLVHRCKMRIGSLRIFASGSEPPGI